MRNVVAGLLIFCFLDGGAGYAALGCYAEKCLPLVYRFDVDARGLRARLGRRWATSSEATRTVRFNGTSWTEDEPYPKPDREPQFHCPTAIRARNYAEITDSSWQESDMTVCAATDNYIYAGLGYYDGEGVDGRGGLLRLDRRSGHVERRLPLLEDVSVNAVVAQGSTAWFGTTFHQECIGVPFAHGLVLYDWSTGEIKTYEGSDDGPAGFVVHDLHLSGRALWVATDAGISRLDIPTGRWRHWLPEERNDGRIEANELPAERILRILHRTLPPDCFRSDNFENQLLEGLAKFRPKLFASLRRPSA